VMKPLSFGTMQLIDIAIRDERASLDVQLTTNSSAVMFDFIQQSNAIWANFSRGIFRSMWLPSFLIKTPF
ncbi:hypothetical protein, partial [Klebsiella pneumoniae]